MKTIEERALEYANRHKTIEINYFGFAKLYDYSRIYNAEIVSYERGAKDQKAIDEEVRLKKCEDMTEAEYEREVAFTDWYNKNGKGTPTYSDAIEWARRELIDGACKWLDIYLHLFVMKGHINHSALEQELRKAMEE